MSNLNDPRLPERFWSKVAVRDSGCWEWTAARFATGYGAFRIKGRTEYAHRVILSTVGGLEPGKHTDHLCRNRACVNPDHLEVVSQKENLRRGAQGFRLTGKCQSGLHDVSSEDSIYTAPDGSRACRECQRIANRRATKRYRDKKRREKNAQDAVL